MSQQPDAYCPVTKCVDCDKPLDGRPYTMCFECEAKDWVPRVLPILRDVLRVGPTQSVRDRLQHLINTCPEVLP